MKQITKKCTAALTAAGLLLGAAGTFPMPVSAEIAEILFEAEAEDCTVTAGGEVTDHVYEDQYPGFTGTGFVWCGNGGGVTFDIDLKEGATCELTARVYSYLGDRLQCYAVDGNSQPAINIPKSTEWTEVSFGSIYLPAGKHTVELGASSSWGFILYDSLKFGKAKMPEMQVSPEPVDKKATAETKALMKYLAESYGKKIISGQQEIYGSGHNDNYELEFEYLLDKTGHYPAIRGFDFMNYNPLYGWEDGTTGRVIQWVAKRGGIATASWHLNVPIDFENYTLGEAVDWQQCSYKNYQKSNSTFNTAKILEKDSKERAFFDAAVKMLAEQLQLLQDAGVPLIFRPLHEAQGNYGRYGDGTSWFWWGDRGPEVFKELWKLLYTELTETYKLHNLLWEMNLYELDNSDEWYPGDEYVDMVGYDKYESTGPWGTDPATKLFLKLVDETGDRKMVTLSECDTLPAVQGMVDQGAWWMYFCPWYYEGDSDTYNTPELLKELYTSEYVTTLDELPEDLYGYKRGNTSGSWDVAGAYECEDGVLSKNAGTEVVESKFCSGKGYVFLKNSDTANDAIEQTVTVEKAGTYALVWGYQQHYAEEGKTEHLFVNGEEVGDGVLFPHSIMFTESAPVKVALKAGENTVRLETGEGWIWFDYLLVTDGSGVPDETSPATQPAADALPGDVDCNGTVHIADAVLLARFLAEDTEITVSTQGKANAELTDKSTLNSDDLIFLLRMLANLE